MAHIYHSKHPLFAVYVILPGEANWAQSRVDIVQDGIAELFEQESGISPDVGGAPEYKESMTPPFTYVHRVDVPFAPDDSMITLNIQFVWNDSKESLKSFVARINNVLKD